MMLAVLVSDTKAASGRSVSKMNVSILTLAAALVPGTSAAGFDMGEALLI